MLDFSHKPDLAWLAQVLRDAQQAAPDADLLIVGAMARDLWYGYAHGIRIDRKTSDVDFAVAVESWEAFRSLRAALLASGRFTPTRYEQTLQHVSARKIDLVPFGGLEDATHGIEWPPLGEVRMNVFGCIEARRDADRVRLPGGVEAPLVSRPGLVMLKFFAFADRAMSHPLKDAYDLALMLGHYLEAGNTERFYDEHADLLEVEPFDYTCAGFELAGRDVRELVVRNSYVVEELLAALAAMLDKELDPEGANTLLGQAPLEPEEFRLQLIAYQRGLLAQRQIAE